MKVNDGWDESVVQRFREIWPRIPKWRREAALAFYPEINMPLEDETELTTERFSAGPGGLESKP